MFKSKNDHDLKCICIGFYVFFICIIFNEKKKKYSPMNPVTFFYLLSLLEIMAIIIFISKSVYVIMEIKSSFHVIFYKS